ncbi:MAG: protein kinase [Burkholderiales bacterium]|nr:protein kinase [Burkholderiales bacterium]
MTTVLIVEDDDAIRNNVTRLLKLEGYDIVSAVNGREGLLRVREMKPDVVITDIGMPEMDGFALLEAIRGDKAIAGTSVMVLTALDDRASMRRGMTAGADDYLAKPFTRVELLEALESLLKKRGRIEETIQTAVQASEEHLQRAFSESIGGRRMPDKFGLERPDGAVADQVMHATVLFSDIREFTSLAEKLSSTEVAELLTWYFERSSSPVLVNGGRHLKFIGDGLVAVFADTQSDSPLPPSRRALSAALGMALAAHEFRGWLQERFAERGLPPFAIGVGLHAGEVTICRLGPVDAGEKMPIGDTVNMAARLEAASKEFGWTVVATQEVLQEAGAGVQTGGITSLELRPGNFVEVAEIAGLQTTLDDHRHGMAGLAERASEIQAALQVNSEITARAVKGALKSKLEALKDHQFQPGQEPLRMKGYRMVRKIGAGGMTEVYLAVREEDGLAVVLKVLDAGGKATNAHLARFIQEYTLLSRIEHPNVIRIYDQGFTDDHAYIAMEYFERGDLRNEVTRGMSQARVLQVFAQVADALQAVHELGVIHRDLKPENIMMRPDGNAALADFGVAKSMLQAENAAFTQTRHGDVVGTPYYLSPEQALGQHITPATDLYSLGVMLYEMLTGQRPYVAESLDVLLARHLTAPTPQLPAEHAMLQPVLDRLMAKKPADRYPSARALVDDLRQRKLLD